MKTLLAGCCVWTLALGLSACQSSGATVDGKTHEYTLKQKCPALLELDRGESIVLHVSENPSTGYQWQLAKPISLFKTEETYLAGEAKAEMVGVSGVKTYKFTAEQAGQDEIHLIHVRPWQVDNPSSPSVEQWRCRVRIS